MNRSERLALLAEAAELSAYMDEDGPSRLQGKTPSDVEDELLDRDIQMLRAALETNNISAVEYVVHNFCHEGVRFEVDGTVGICSFDIPGEPGEITELPPDSFAKDWPPALQERLFKLAHRVLDQLEHGVMGC